VGAVIRPYLRVLPAALGNRLDEAVLVAEQLGHELDDEQKLALGDITSTTGDGKLAAYEAVISAPRQSGKSLVAEVYAVMHALRGEKILYTGHRSDLAGSIFRRLWATIPEAWGVTATFSNGREQLQFPKGGGLIVFKTRTPRVGRGDSYDKLIVDEAQAVTEEDLDGVRPTLRTRPDPQILFAACAPNGRVNVNCLVLKSLRDRAREGDSERLVFLEWSGVVVEEDEELQAHQMPEGLLEDRTVWKRATPGFGQRITEERMAAELESMGAVSFAIEALNVPLWPDLAYVGAGPVIVSGWEALIDERSELNPDEPFPEAVLAFDMSPQRATHLCLVGRRRDALHHLDYAGRFEGAAAAVAAITKVVEREDIDVRAVVCDGTPENLALLKRLLHDSVVTERQTREGGASRLGQEACGSLIDFVNEGRFRHRGQSEFTASLRGAVAKPIGDGWAYSRSKSRSDVSPLLAAACALHVGDMEIDVAGARGGIEVF
jgi:hypothetical protein